MHFSNKMPDKRKPSLLNKFQTTKQCPVRLLACSLSRNSDLNDTSSKARVYFNFHQKLSPVVFGEGTKAFEIANRTDVSTTRR